VDIFLSYASEDRLKAVSIVKLFEEAGWQVWWDQAIGPGDPWEPAVLERVRAAKCVVVLWSRASVGKEWVEREAAEAEANGTLVPVLLQPTRLPRPSPHIQALRLATWEGDWTDQLRALLEAVRTRIGHGTLPDLAAPASRRRASEHIDRIERIEAAQAAMEYCASALKFELLRRGGHAFAPEEMQEGRDAYQRLASVLSTPEVPFQDEDLHELQAPFMDILYPPDRAEAPTP
jgi:hypothetical protein